MIRVKLIFLADTKINHIVGGVIAGDANNRPTKAACPAWSTVWSP